VTLSIGLTLAGAWARMVCADEPAQAARESASEAPGVFERTAERYLEALKRERPGDFERLVRLRRENPDEFRREMRRRWEERERREAPAERPPIQARHIENPTAKPERPSEPVETRASSAQQVDQIMAEVERLAERYRQADPAQRESIAAKVKQLVTRAFELREQERMQRVQRMERELQALKEELQRRQQHRKEIIERKVAEVLGMDPTAW
jgi:hypothetical protein